MDPVKITTAEYEVMNILWEKGESTSRELSEILEQTVGWKSATTKTLLGRLVKKNVLATQKEGSRYLYRPAVSQHKALAAAVEDFASQICPRSLGEVGVHLIEKYPMDSISLKKLMDILKEKVPNDHIKCSCIPYTAGKKIDEEGL